MPEDRLKSPRVRLFVALDLPADALAQLVTWRQEALGARRDLRLPERSALHVTLVFLGYRWERDAERIAELAFSEPAEPFALRPLEVVEIPPRRPRLYALSLEDAGERLGAWQGSLAKRLADAGLYELEKRPFWPHVTLARFKETERHRGGGPAPRRGSGAPQAAGPPPELPDELQTPFEAVRATLYKSTLRPQGALYEPLTRVSLASGAVGDAASKPASSSQTGT